MAETEDLKVKNLFNRLISWGLERN